jgi:shikimate kinase
MSRVTVPSPRHLVLVGLMGAGKSTVGEQCAARLGRPFLDTDALIEASTGATLAELFATRGEDGFRELERAAVADACDLPEPAVVACGGGAVLDADNRRRLHAAGLVVWLRATPAELAARVGAGAGRPLLVGGPVPTLERLAETRAAAYDAAADVTIDTDGRAVAEVVDRVLEAFGA